MIRFWNKLHTLPRTIEQRKCIYLIKLDMEISDPHINKCPLCKEPSYGHLCNVKFQST